MTDKPLDSSASIDTDRIRKWHAHRRHACDYEQIYDARQKCPIVRLADEVDRLREALEKRKARREDDECLTFLIETEVRAATGPLEEEIARLREALDRLIQAAESYMGYHNKKRGESDLPSMGPMDGLNPAIREAREALDGGESE